MGKTATARTLENPGLASVASELAGRGIRASSELGRALPLPAPAAHEVQAQRDAGQNEERKRLHFHSESLIGLIRLKL